MPGTKAAAAYGAGASRVTEQFMCRFGVNETFRERLFSGDLRISGADAGGHVRIAESVSNPFFMGTLFVPQMSSLPERPHPLIMAFVEAAAA